MICIGQTDRRQFEGKDTVGSILLFSTSRDACDAIAIADGATIKLFQ